MSAHTGNSMGGHNVASKDCSNEQCPGTAMWDSACKDYVCIRCHTHHKGLCRVCHWDPADEAYFTEDPEEAMRGA